MVVRCLAVLLFALTCWAEDPGPVQALPGVADAEASVYKAQEIYVQTLAKAWKESGATLVTVPAETKDPRKSETDARQAAIEINAVKVKVDHEVDIYLKTLEAFRRKTPETYGRRVSEVGEMTMNLRYYINKYFAARAVYDANNGQAMAPELATPPAPEKKKGTIKAKLADGTTVEQ